MQHVSRIALERNEDTRDCYQMFIAENFHPDQLVFVNESASNWITTKRPMAWSSIGTRACRHDYLSVGKDGILHLDVLDRSYMAATFNKSIDSLLDIMNPLTP
ncbi:hypothetical protein BDR04DRAFT_1149795 [Suillus decipiens]|nr:hypothetical protein BDR04DRAFT_1149795 [Suillus decipiens]